MSHTSKTTCLTSSCNDLGSDCRETTTIGSFYPLFGSDHNAQAVLFAYAIDTPDQQRAIREEAMARLTAVSSLSEALLTMQIDDHGRRSHVRFMEIIAILLRDAKGLVEAAARTTNVVE